MTIENNKYPATKQSDIKQSDGGSADAKPDSQRNKTASELEVAISETRVALSDDVKALSAAATPAHIKHEVKQVAKQAKDAAYETVAETATELKDNVIDKAVAIKDVAVHKAIALKDATADKANEVKDVAVDKVHELKEATVEAAHHTADAISETFDEVSERSRRVGAVAWRFTAANALPLGLIGVGAGLLLSNQRRPRASALPRYNTASERRRWADETAYDASIAYPAGGRSPANGSRGARTSGDGQNKMATANQLARPAESKLEQAEDSLAHTAHAVYEQTGRVLETTKRKVGEGAARGRDVVKQNWQRAQRVSTNIVAEHPLALALGTVLAGVGIGLLLPATAKEDELLRPSREKLRRALGTARGVADDVTHLAKETANETVASFEGDRA